MDTHTYLDPPADWNPVITKRDRLIFNIFRASVGTATLGLVVALYAALVLAAWRSPEGEVSPANSHSSGRLWTDEDAEAMRGIVVISAVRQPRAPRPNQLRAS